jgi:hypothetical protein
MAKSLIIMALLHSSHLASAHYAFPIFIFNGIRSDWWQYIRPIALDPYGYHFNPVRTYTDEPQVCGIGATKTGHQVATAVIKAGSEIGFQVIAQSNVMGFEPVRPANPELADFLYHTGPAQLFLSKAPGALEDYEGDGEWFKVGVQPASDGKTWDSYMKNELNFTIPATTPPGKYLARVEHLYIFPQYNETQQFINCAHIEIVGPGGGTPGPTIKFPGGYALDDPGVWLPNELSQDEMKNFPGAGPVVWRG